MAMYTRRRNLERGFTLIELMITLALLAILISIAAPSFTSMLERNRASGLATALAADIQLIRSEATKRNIQTSLNLSTNGYFITAGGEQIKSITFTNKHPKTFVSQAGSGTSFPLVLTFNPRLARLNEGATAFKVGSGDSELQVSVNPLGRAKICGGLGGYPAC